MGWQNRDLEPILRSMVVVVMNVRVMRVAVQQAHVPVSVAMRLPLG